MSKRFGYFEFEAFRMILFVVGIIAITLIVSQFIPYCAGMKAEKHDVPQQNIQQQK